RVSIEVPTVPNQSATASASLELDYDGGDTIYIRESKGLLYCGYQQAISSETSVSYDATAHLYWQLREAAGTIFCEASPGGKTWSMFGSFDYALQGLAPPALVRVLMIGQAAANTSAPGSVQVAALNGGKVARRPGPSPVP